MMNMNLLAQRVSDLLPAFQGYSEIRPLVFVADGYDLLKWLLEEIDTRYMTDSGLSDVIAQYQGVVSVLEVARGEAQQIQGRVLSALPDESVDLTSAALEMAAEIDELSTGWVEAIAEAQNVADQVIKLLQREQNIRAALAKPK